MVYVGIAASQDAPSEKSVHVKAKVGEDVTVTALRITATIIGVNIGRTGEQYQIAYFNQGRREECWLMPHEFEAREESKS
jgi:hypothetical protein